MWPHKTTWFKVMWLYGWKLLAECHHPNKFGDHRHCDIREIDWRRFKSKITDAHLIHGTIILTGITWKKIPYYMRDSACRYLIVESAKIFWSYVKHFWIFPRERNCKVLIGLYHRILYFCLYNKFSWIIQSCFLTETIKES